MFNLTNLAGVFGVAIQWNFFESYHGKGAVDAVGGTSKQLVWTAVRSGRNVSNAADFKAVCDEKKTKISVIEIAEDDIANSKPFLDRQWGNIKAIPQTHALHHIKVLKRGKIEYANLTKIQSNRQVHSFV